MMNQHGQSVTNSMGKKKVHFIAGIYGTGKTTVCKQVSGKLGIPFYEASELIKKRNGEQYGVIKHVKNINANQDILAGEITRIIEDESEIILAGHFAIFDKDHVVKEIPTSVFSELCLSEIILLQADIGKIVKNLNQRDGKKYLPGELELLAEAEQRLA